MVRCKFKCEWVKDGTVQMRPVSSGSPENESFFKYTPGGNFLLSTVNENAIAQFREGQEYYIDIHPADPPA